MPSTNKTTNLNLNQWIGTDKPKREDFISDNNILDTVISGHINNNDIHVTETLLSQLSSSVSLGMTFGTGEETQSIQMPFEPSMVIILAAAKPLVEYNTSSNYVKCNSGIAFQSTYGSSLGVSLTGNQLTVQQTLSSPSGGVYYNLNNSAEVYIYAAFK